jgi:hypothetical protein
MLKTLTKIMKVTMKKEGKKTSPCRHTTFTQNCAFGNFEKRLKNDLPFVIHASKLAKQR